MTVDNNKESFQFARNIHTGLRIHISKAASGRKGYVCLGCGQGMIAHRGQVNEHHFQHDPLDVTRKGKCTYSDETERHRVAKDILQRLRCIQVPVLRKYPPAGVSEKAVKLKDARLVEAASVENELHFYETASGEINFTSKAAWREESTKYLLIKPDVTFFDKEGNPILLIELVATHKPDDEKLAKIRSLGIDAVQVLLPKTSPEGIEDALLRGNHTQWLYNYEREKTEYLQLSPRSGSSISSTDENEDIVFEETFACRTSEIKGLIRRIRNGLGSEHYQRIERNLTGELSRVTDNTTRHRERLHELQANHEAAIRDEFSERFAQINREQEQIDKYHGRVESRYYQVKSECIDETNQLATEEAEFEPDCQGEIKRTEAEIAQLTTSYRPTCQGEIDWIEGEISRLETEIEQFGNEGSTLIAIQGQLDQEAASIERTTVDVSSEQRAVDERRSTLPTTYQRLEAELVTAYQQEEGGLEPEAIRGREELSATFQERERGIRADHEAYRRAASNAIKHRDGREAPRLSKPLKDLFAAESAIRNIWETNAKFRCLQAAREAIRTGSWKNWA